MENQPNPGIVYLVSLVYQAQPKSSTELQLQKLLSFLLFLPLMNVADKYRDTQTHTERQM